MTTKGSRNFYALAHGGDSPLVTVSGEARHFRALIESSPQDSAEQKAPRRPSFRQIRTPGRDGAVSKNSAKDRPVEISQFRIVAINKDETGGEVIL